MAVLTWPGRAGGKGAAQDALRRATDADWAPESETAFADGFPFLLIGEVIVCPLAHRGGRREKGVCVWGAGGGGGGGCSRGFCEV